MRGRERYGSPDLNKTEPSTTSLGSGIALNLRFGTRRDDTAKS